MKKLLLILLCLPFIGFGQGWETNFGGIDSDIGYSVQQTADGGYVITGSGSFGNGSQYVNDVYLIKTDGSGNELWSKTFGGTYSDIGYSVQQTTDGGYIITGLADGGVGFGDVYLIKTDGSGNELWSKIFGVAIYVETAYSVQQTTDGGYIITGSNVDYMEGDTDHFLTKTDANGVEQWTYIRQGAEAEAYARSVQQTTDGGYIITGSTNCCPGTLSFMGGNVYLIKIDGNGIEQWNKKFGGTGYDEGKSVQQTTDGGYVITGLADGGVGGQGFGDVYLIKTDGSGNELWSKTFGGIGYDEGSSVQQTTDGGYIITGSTLSFGNGSWDVYLIKTDVSGIEQWTKTFGGIDWEKGYSVQQTTDGGYVITGSSNSGAGDVYLIKTDANGNATSTFNIPIKPNRELQKTVDILGRETKQSNQPLLYLYDDGSTEKKIIID